VVADGLAALAGAAGRAVAGSGAYPRRVRTVHRSSPRGGGSSPSRERPCAVAGRAARLGRDVPEVGYMIMVRLYDNGGGKGLASWSRIASRVVVDVAELGYMIILYDYITDNII
jgi:hypothetical protein